MAFHLPKQSALIVYCPAHLEPERMNTFMFVDGICVTNTANPMYNGQDRDFCYGAMTSIMRYEDGTEPQPNTGHSANGYPSFLEVFF